MASLQKSQKSKGKKQRPEVVMRQNHAKLSKHFERLLCFREALYNPATKQKLFIINAGVCLKSDCKLEQTLHMVKVLMPKSCQDQFRKSVPLDLIGKRVVCFVHFPFDVQIHYLTNGSFPAGAKMIQFTKTTPNSGPRHSPGALNKDDSWVRQIFTIMATTKI